VLRENVTTKDIQAFAAARLADFKVPRKIIILDEIPKGPTGKLQRIGLADKLGLTASEPATADFVAPTTPIEKKLAEIWSQVPLSFSQQRMWFLDQLEPGNPAYNRPSSIRLTGPLNVAALEKSLNEIIHRHEVLRTHFPMNKGTAIQVIASNLNLTLSVTDISDCPDRETEAQRLAASEAQRPFNLAQGPLIRAGLLRLNKDVHVLLLTMHHIVFDGWSMGVLLRELATLYNAFCIGKPSPLAKLPVQYVDFAHWQRLQGETLNTQLSYWKQKLADISVLNLPTDRPRPAVQTFRGGKQSLVLSKSLSDSLKALSQQENVTLFMTLLAAFQILLHRYTGQDDIIVGSPIAGRHLVETEKLIGVFINTLVLRTDFSGNPTFQTLLAHVRETALGAYAHQTVPFEKLVEELQPERDLSRTPMFQVLFQLRNIPNDALKVQGLRMDEFEFDTGVTQLDLALDMVDKPEGLSCVLMYNADLFNADTIKRMDGHFQTLLTSIVENPAQLIHELPLLTAAEYQQLKAWNDTTADYPIDLCLHQLFEAQVEKTPEAVAVMFQAQQLTYRELNNQANQLAHHLQALGVKPEVLVGICIERSLEMIIGLLGILKAGGAYLPLDPAYPTARLAFMLEDAGVGVLLTQSSLVSLLPKTIAQIVCLDTEKKRLSRLSTDNLACGVASFNLAYVIYTSGSTGKPKGVLIEHRSLCNLTNALIQIFGVQIGSRVLQFSSLSFDAATADIFIALCSGATLYLVSREIVTSPSALIQELGDQSITLLKIPASVLGHFSAHQLPALHTLSVGGDICSPEVVAQWSKDRCFFNAYGPTESTICATVFEYTGGYHKLPIGRPIANTQVYILDQNLQPTPIGVLGELHISGVGLSRGYLNLPELTTKKFIPNPFSSESNSRLYKTGDLARYLPDGNIEYLGRIDNQVKIRGFRIELGEIEAVLVQHPEVREAVVIVREEHPTDKRLVAYLVLNPAQETMPHTLRRFIKEKLPDYMVPSAFVRLDAIPLTPNGKIDHRALSAPDQTRSYLEETFVAPRTPIEERLVEIWAEVLHNEQIGIHDNFFELGGHSLLATQIISRISEAFAVELSLRSLFETPTVVGLAESITQQLIVADDDMAELLAELEGVSEDEAQRLLATAFT
jgi:amino acid adenylation domain-containing protein